MNKGKVALMYNYAYYTSTFIVLGTNGLSY